MNCVERFLTCLNKGSNGRVSEWFKEHAWKACGRNSPASSNLAPSANGSDPAG